MLMTKRWRWRKPDDETKLNTKNIYSLKGKSL